MLIITIIIYNEASTHRLVQGMIYPDRASTASSRPFVNEWSMLSNLLWSGLYTDKIWVKEGEPTTLKVFVGHDLPVAAFNLIEFAKAADDLDCTVAICVYVIQSI